MKNIGIISLLLLFTSVQAASFDCTRARTRIEKQICTDPNLSNLDEEVADAFRDILRDQANSASTRQSQREWLERRDICVDAECLEAVYVERLYELDRQRDSAAQPISSSIANVARTGDSGKTLAESGSGSHPLIVHGKSNPVCQDALSLLKKEAKNEFVHGYWKENFGKPYWMALAGSGYTYTSIDIDNDGRSEIVAKETHTIRSVQFDSIVSLPKRDFLNAPEGSHRNLIESYGFQLNPSNSVHFSNGDSAVPVFTAIWNRKQENYLAMMEFFFAHEEQEEDGRRLPNSFFVGVLDMKSFQYDSQYKVNRLVPTMVCRIVWQ